MNPSQPAGGLGSNTRSAPPNAQQAAVSEDPMSRYYEITAAYKKFNVASAPTSPPPPGPNPNDKNDNDPPKRLSKDAAKLLFNQVEDPSIYLNNRDKIPTYSARYAHCPECNVPIMLTSSRTFVEHKCKWDGAEVVWNNKLTGLIVSEEEVGKRL